MNTNLTNHLNNEKQNTMKTQTYNGWTNYETWNVKLWLDNDQGTQEYWNERATEIYNSPAAIVKTNDGFTRTERAVLLLAESLKFDLDDSMHDMGVPKLNGFYADLLNTALSEVNWHEIAESFLEDVEKSPDNVDFYNKMD